MYTNTYVCMGVTFIFIIKEEIFIYLNELQHQLVIAPLTNKQLRVLLLLRPTGDPNERHRHKLIYNLTPLRIQRYSAQFIYTHIHMHNICSYIHTFMKYNTCTHTYIHFIHKSYDFYKSYKRYCITAEPPSRKYMHTYNTCICVDMQVSVE